MEDIDTRILVIREVAKILARWAWNADMRLSEVRKRQAEAQESIGMTRTEYRVFLDAYSEESHRIWEAR